jgi:hypothetical protein
MSATHTTELWMNAPHPPFWKVRIKTQHLVSDQIFSERKKVGFILLQVCSFSIASLLEKQIFSDYTVFTEEEAEARPQ